MPDIYKDLFNNAPVSIIEMDYSPMVKLCNEIKSARPSLIRSFLLKNSKRLKECYSKVKVLQINKGALVFYRVKSKTAFFQSLSKSFSGRAADILTEQFVALFSGDGEFCGEMKCRPVRGQTQDVFMRVSVIGKNPKDLSKVIMTLQDITPWKKVERHLRKQAQIDGLTGLLNQSAMIDRLNQELIRVKRYGLELSCMMIDLDFFKVINDKFGHQKGDAILKKVSKMIRGCFRKSDVLGRYGGDEFMVILPETSSRNSYYAAQRLRKLFSTTLFRYKSVISFHITLSVGIAGYSARKKKKIENANDLITLADNEMYNCKKAGRDQISVAKL